MSEMMPVTDPNRPSLERIVDDLRREVAALRRRTPADPPPGVRVYETLFSHFGEVVNQKPSAPYRVIDIEGAVTYLDMSVNSVANAFDVDVLLNGVVETTLSITTSDLGFVNIEDCLIEVEDGDIIQMQPRVNALGSESITIRMKITVDE